MILPEAVSWWWSQDRKSGHSNIRLSHHPALLPRCPFGGCDFRERGLPRRQQRPGNMGEAELAGEVTDETKKAL